MRSGRASLFRYRLPLVAPVALASGPLTVREGLLLRLDSEDGTTGWGEAAPLPGFSPDTLEAAEAALCDFVTSLHALHAAGTRFVQLTSVGPPMGWPPSARAALSGALLELEAEKRGLLLPHVLSDASASVPEHVHVAALLAGDAAAVLRGARAASEAGYRAVKLKVGRQSVDADAALVRRVAEMLGPRVALRLDANRAWAFEEAVRFAGLVEDVGLAYVEEPLAEPLRLPELIGVTGMPVALDESLAEGETDERLWPYHGVRALVLKPQALGGVRAAHEKSQIPEGKARQPAGMSGGALGAQPVVSALFESGVGTRHAVALAAALGATWGTVPAGLDPYRHLADDVFAERLPLDGPVVDVTAVLAPREPDLSKLERVL